jgi:hypothetical protein
VQIVTRLHLVGALLIFQIAFTGCRENSPDRPGSSTRTLSSISPQLTRTLTPALAMERLGAPDVVTGSGLIIYKYRLEGGDTLSLGFPGYAPIVYAQVFRADGTRADLPLR